MKKALLISSVLLLTFTAIVSPATALTVSSPPATSGADIDPEIIKENIKKRIEQAIKNQNTDASKKKVAYIGTLTSVTKNSFNLESSTGTVKQASTSASTVFINLPNNREMKEADVSIGDYLAALGFLNEETKVLDARRILVLSAPPEIPPRKSFYGLITALDLKKNTITLKNPKTNNDVTVVMTAKTKLSTTNGTPHTTTITNKDLKLELPTLVLFLPGKTDKESNTATTILTQTKSENTTKPNEASPAPSPSIKP